MSLGCSECHQAMMYKLIYKEQARARCIRCTLHDTVSMMNLRQIVESIHMKQLVGNEASNDEDFDTPVTL